MPEESDRELRTRTVLVIVIERFACMASTRLPLRPINRRSPTRGSCSLSPLAYPFTKFLPEQRVDQDEMIRSLDRSSTSTSTSTSTKNSHKSGKDARCRAPSPHHLACGSGRVGSTHKVPTFTSFLPTVGRPRAVALNSCLLPWSCHVVC